LEKFYPISLKDYNVTFRADLWVNARDLFHATALMYAAQQEQGEQCVKLLLG
jgi:hypothetical protein